MFACSLYYAAIGCVWRDVSLWRAALYRYIEHQPVAFRNTAACYVAHIVLFGTRGSPKYLHLWRSVRYLVSQPAALGVILKDNPWHYAGHQSVAW